MASNLSPAEKLKYLSAKSKVEERFKISGIIHERKPMRIPSVRVPIALNYLNIMLPFIIEGYMEDNLKKIQGFKRLSN
jgi:hypothetical protein